MIEIERFGDVERIRLASWGSRLAGMDVSAYLVHGVLVDSGFPLAQRALAEFLDERPIIGAMLTHYHEDHAGNAELLAGRGIPLAMHALTLDRLRDSAAIRLYRRAVWGTTPRLTSAPRAFVSEVPLEFVHTPGHSADHQIIWDPARATVFSGDLWLGVRATLMHENEDPYQIVESLRAVLALSPERVFDAHRGPVRDPVAALAAKISYLEDAIAAIKTKQAAGWSDRAILRRLLGGDETVAIASGGEYARMNFVRAVRRGSRVEGRGSSEEGRG
ncbi:MAG TPA: MBL fold metallo-hydrolase [Gemmatimonadaceae bacterium]|jgi:glyoxylase-like metal-dependent hydrolase (beta-lactamase superfamily II)